MGDRLVDRCGFVGGCRSVKGFVRKLRGRQFAGSLRRERDGDPRRDDYGTGPTFCDPRRGASTGVRACSC